MERPVTPKLSARSSAVSPSEMRTKASARIASLEMSFFAGPGGPPPFGEYLQVTG